MAKTGTLEPIEIVPGVQPPTDKTEVNTKHFTYADKIRFMNGVAQKIGGFLPVSFDYGLEITGYVRSIYSSAMNTYYWTLFGSNEHLYAVIGSQLTNITPLADTSTAIANSLDTHYATLANNPMAAVISTRQVTVTDSEAAKFQVNDRVTFSGATGFAGILAANINGSRVITSIGSGTYTFNAGTAATSTASGGGAAVVRSSGLLTVNAAAHAQTNGDRVKLASAANTGGILAADINAEFIIRNVATNTFDIMTEGTATSSVSLGGGAATVYYKEIPPGAVDQGYAQGYGAGLYGAGLYGTALVSSTGVSFPRIWFFDRYANTILMTPGNGKGVYQWFGDVGVAPAKVANAPDEVNYLFVSNNILVTFGAPDGVNPVPNRIFASDLNDITNWTSSSTNQVYDDNVEGAGRLISHVPAGDYNLIFTENQTYTFRYIGLPFVWEIKLLDPVIGIIAPMARVNAKGIAYWMSPNNFYMYRGAMVEVIPANSQEQCTCLNYVFNDLNYGQQAKIFAWYNEQYNEVWFHYPSGGSTECDRVVVVNLLTYTWTLHNFDRTAAEYPNLTLKLPRLANISDIYQHETGHDAGSEPLEFTLRSNKRFYGKDNANLNQIYPDSVQDGSISFTNTGYRFPQSATAMGTKTYTVGSDTETCQAVQSARFHQYEWSGDELGQSWIMGTWMEEVQKGPTQ